MSRYDIERWEQEQAEVEIRRWLTAIGQWAPNVAYDRLQQQKVAETAYGDLNAAQNRRHGGTEIITRVP